MIKRTIRIVSFILVVIGLVAADVRLPWSEGSRSDAYRVLAQSRKRSKKKEHVVRRQQPRHSTSAHRQQPRHDASARRRQPRHDTVAHRRKSRRDVAPYRRQVQRNTIARRQRRGRIVLLRVGQQIPRDRVLEIQRALVERGFLKETTGVYDNATVEAMKAFQTTENIPVTGYPTAHALHRLRLSPGPTPTTSAISTDGASPDADRPQRQ